MPTAVECVCCSEIQEVKKVIEECEPTVNASCITEHEGFEAVCLNIWVLQAAYFLYRQQYGTSDVRDQPLHK